mgnify:CR=1 FL=1
MASLSNMIVTILVLFVVAMTVESADRKLECSGVIQNSPLDTYKEVCHYIASWKDEYKESLTVMNRLDVIEMCTCNLLNHPIVWQAMFTHEVETLYYATRKLVDDRDVPENAEVSSTNIVFQDDVDNHMFFWDHFNSLLRETNQKKQHDQLSRNLFALFAEHYYNPDSYSVPFKGNPQSMNLRRVISSTCNQLLSQFGSFLKYFSNLMNLTNNPRYVYRIVRYDDTLYKIFGVIKMCQFLSLSGELI